MMDSATTKAYEAFRVQPIIESLPGHQRVESLCCWDEYLLVGLQDGTVVQYSAQRDGGPWQVVKGRRSLERKAVVQMATVRVASRALLLTLTEDGVNLLTLPDMQLKFQPMGSRGASLFAWSEESQLLAVAVRRKVILYQLRGSELLEAGERTAPDVVSAMVWVGAGMLLLGMRRQYVLLNTGTAAVADVAPTGTAPHPLAQLCPGGQEMLLVRDSSTYYHSTTDGRYSRRRHLVWSEPLLALVSAGAYAIAVTASGLEVRSLRRVAEGHVVQRVTLTEPPRPVPPAVSGDGAVFVVTAATAATTTAGASAGGAGTAGGSAIYQLVRVPLEEQAHTLAEMGEYSEALALAEMVDDDDEVGSGAAAAAHRTPPSSGGGAGPAPDDADAAAAAAAKGAPRKPASSRRALLEERLRLAYGHYLFKAGEYDEGMAQLALCKSTRALVLLRLFPSLVPAKFQHYLPTEAAGQPLPVVSEPTGEAYGTAVSQLLPYILSHRTRAITALAEQEEEAKAAAAMSHEGKAAAMSHEGKAAAMSHEGKAAADGAGAAGSKTGSAATNGAAGDSARRQLQERERSSSNSQASSSAAAVVTSSKAPARGPPAAGGGDSSELLLAPPPALPPRELLVVLDTAIVRIMVVMPDTGSLLRFVQLNNFIDLLEGEQALSDSGMYAELAALYKYNGCHEQGLELLRKLSQEPGALPRPARGAAADLPGLPGVWAAVRYMVSLSAEHAATIQRHAGWILAADPEAGLSALLHMRPPLHPSLALSILNQHSRHYCGLYLETALQIGVALPQDYHNELLLIYLRDILSKEPLSPSRASNHSGDELKELLLSHRPDPDQPPLLFPEDIAHALLNNPPPQSAAAAAAAAARRFASAPASSVGTPSGISRVASQTSLQSGQGAAGRAVGGKQGGRSRSTGAGTGTGVAVPSGPASVASTEDSERSSGDDEDDEDEDDEDGEGSGAEVDGGSGQAPRPVTPSNAAAARQRQPGALSPPAHGAAAATAPRQAPPPPRTPPRRPSATTTTTTTTSPAQSRGARTSRRPRRPRRSSAGTLGAAGKPPLPPYPAGTSLSSPRVGPDAEAAASAATAAAAGPSLYQRLRDLVYTSPYIDPGYVLDKLPTGELLEIRALMLERLGNHREALRLYVHALRDLTAAEAYCDRVYAATAAAAGGGDGHGRRPPPTAGRDSLDAGVLGGPGRPGDIYLQLVQALFDGPESCPSAAAVAAAGGFGAAPGGGWLAGREAEGGAKLDPATWQALSRLLSRKRDRMDPMQVLTLLPDGVAVLDVLPWLESALRYTLEARRNLSVIRQLRRSENLSALEDAVHMRQHRVVVTSERACSLCHKRIGSAVSVSYPGGLLAHYLCHKRYTGGAGGGGGAEAGIGGVGTAAPGGGGVLVVEMQHGGPRGVRVASAGGAEVATWA